MTTRSVGRLWSRRWPVALIVLAIGLTTAAQPLEARGEHGGRRHRPTADPVAGPDFDGNGRADLVIGLPYDSSTRRAAGAVEVIYGTPGGLRPAGHQVWTQASPGVPDEAEIGDQFGWALATADFDGDGFSDLAVTSRGEDIAAPRDGSVTVLYGTPGGLSGDRAQLWHQDVEGIEDAGERHDQFGWTLVPGDFDGDGYGDLAVGVPFEDLLESNEGAVHVLYGAPGGLGAARAQAWTQAPPELETEPEADDRFGWGLTSGDFDGDGFDELAASAPYESWGGRRVGIVHVIRGSAGGLTTTGAQTWGQDSPGILDQAELRDQFGQSLASGDLDGDGFGDLVVGVWFEDYRYIGNEGGLHVIHGSPAGLTADRDQFWNQDSPGLADITDQGDQFSQTLAVGDLNGDGFDDVAVGVPWEDFLPNVYHDAGAVQVLYGTSAGLNGAGSQLWSQGAGGIGGGREWDDHFGEALGIADFDGDGHDDLAVGIPWEDLGLPNVGAVQVIRGSAAGLTAARARLWSEGALGEPAAEKDRFGWAVSGRLPRGGTPRLCYGDRGGSC